MDDEINHEGFGPTDELTLRTIRDLLDRHEPLIESMGFDSVLNPQKLHVTLSVGFAEPGRFDIRWSTTNNYTFHYTEKNFDFRFDKHPNPHSPLKHFHCSGESSSIEARSCIEVEQAELVTLAVIQCWRRALNSEDLSLLNTADNPP